MCNKNDKRSTNNQDKLKCRTWSSLSTDVENTSLVAHEQMLLGLVEFYVTPHCTCTYILQVVQSLYDAENHQRVFGCVVHIQFR